MTRRAAAVGGRAPHGARGLKLALDVLDDRTNGRAPHGARGLKPLYDGRCRLLRRRAPHGARGLKQRYFEERIHGKWSRPAWGAWIEILVPVIWKLIF